MLGKSECDEASEDELELLRFLTPLLKLYTAKQAISVCSEGLEGKRIKKKKIQKWIQNSVNWVPIHIYHLLVQVFIAFCTFTVGKR